MTLIADFYLETPVLRLAVDAAPEMEVTIEQQTSRESKPFALAFWASNGDFETFDAGLADDPTISDVTVLAELPDQRLYQVELTDKGDEQMTYHSWADQGGVFVSSERAGDGWRARIRFPDRESLRNYVTFCEDHGLTFELRQLYDASERDDDSLGLTDRQYETLRTAAEMGYFDVPRAVELEDLAEQLGVSRQAVSERLRRATEALVRATIFREGGATDPEK
ncbi:helix-turn-helix domain-containing protein [Halorussus gelatinilyticus]|uniref:Helix-turn-helix domain-containing protein n=1 Tax=Halorussus gelatinilyticus TaxID=2937524 RepID=A0A8U0IEK9_9EURY|nr:helix-turn-helix domain-containing protein [Halorussus gelatinilyticus]UPV99184.1 helix-turn-helix domain-containing protein [Halorussus gelatinilyticus]